MLNQAKTSPITESYDHIELTQEEINEVLRIARKKKHHQIETENYWKRISEPVQYPKLDASQIREIAMKKLKEICGGNLIITEQNHRILNLLSFYFSGDSRFEENTEFSLQKGIILVGPVGCGKTSIMKAFAVNSHNSYAIFSSRYISSLFTTEGFDGIEKFYNSLPVYPQNHYGQTEIGYCFDDLGTESIKKNYGNESNVMSEIILSRYDKPQLRNKTHFTGNFSGDDIEGLYGSRVRSRLREICNFIVFDTNSPDFRK